MRVQPNNTLQRTRNCRWPHRARRGDVCTGRCGIVRRTMKWIHLLVGIVAITFPCQASEGTYIAALYYCSANEVNAATVSACSTAHPEVSESLAAALENWRAHYGERATAAATVCEGQLRAMAKKESMDWDSFQLKIAEARAKFISEIRSSATSADPTFCRGVQTYWANVPNDFEESMWKDK